MRNLSIVVLISGQGSNLQAIIDAIAAEKIPAKILAVISNRSNAYGLIRAQQAHLPTHVLEKQHFINRAAFDKALQDLIDSYAPDLVVLAGFMHILSAELVAAYQGRMFNIHPSLLPKYPGLHTHTQALQANDKEHGASVHFVTDELDGGPIIAQARLSINANDTPTRLQERVHELEHALYPTVIEWFANNRLVLKGGAVYLDGKMLQQNGVQFPNGLKSPLPSTLGRGLG